MEQDQQSRMTFVQDVRRVLGGRLADLSERQKELLDRSLGRLLDKGKWTDDELEGKFEMITEHVSPKSHEMVQANFNSSQETS